MNLAQGKADEKEWNELHAAFLISREIYLRWKTL